MSYSSSIIIIDIISNNLKWMTPLIMWSQHDGTHEVATHVMWTKQQQINSLYHKWVSTIFIFLKN